MLPVHKLLHSSCLEKKTSEGNTALHYSALHNKPECVKLLLKGKAVLHTGVYCRTTSAVLTCKP